MKIILYFTVIVIIKNTDIFRKYLNDNKNISMCGKSYLTPWGYIFNCITYVLLGYRLLTELFNIFLILEYLHIPVYLNIPVNTIN